MAHKGDAVRLQDLPVDDIVGGFTNENAVLKIPAEKLVSIWSGAARGRHLENCVGPIESLLRPADSEDAVPLRIVGEHACGRVHPKMGIARQVMLRQKVMPEPPAVVVAEPVPPIIAVTAKLSRAWLKLHHS